MLSPRKLAEARHAYVREACEKIDAGETIRNQAIFLHRAYPHLFNSEDAARGTIRYARGAQGARNRNCSGPNRIYSDKRSSIEEGVAKLYESDKVVLRPLVINPGKHLLLPDIHIPIHCHKSLAVALRDIKSYDSIIIPGDMIDFHHASTFLKNPFAPRIKNELATAREFLYLLRENAPNARIVFMSGNHVERWQHYLWRQAEGISDMEQLQLDKILGFEDAGIEMVLGRSLVKIGKLSVLHGHELSRTRFTPANIAKTMLLKTKVCTIFGHHHTISSYSEATLHGDRIHAWSMGCLCTLHPEYDPYAHTRWSNGFAVVESDSDGMFEVRNYRILDNKAVLG